MKFIKRKLNHNEYLYAESPRGYKYTIRFVSTGEVGYMKDSDLIPTYKRLKNCPKWIREVIKLSRLK